MKCDEQQPVCKNCIKSKRKCIRGIRLNFTQYTIYEPPINPYQNNLTYRILDQSVTIASLYENGKQQYAHYVPFHSWEDLRESEIQFQKDMHYSMPVNPNNEASINDAEGEMWFHQYQPKVSKMPSGPTAMEYKSIGENKEFSNLLMKNDSPQLSDDSEQYQAVVLQNDYPQMIQKSLTSQGEYQELGYDSSDHDLPNNIGAKDFIDLIQHQKYYWFLDLFNELGIWKLVIPNYCLKLSKADNNNDEYKTLLINCLLSCSLETSEDLKPILEQQLKYWYTLELMQLSTDNLPEFEKLMISIVLILMSILIKLQNNKWQIDHECILIFNNQIKIFNKFVDKFQTSNEAKLRKVKSAVFISSIHSISILKFFFNNQYKVDINQISHTDDISYHYLRITNEFTTLNNFEIININSFYRKYDYPQLNHNLEVQPTRSSDTKSDSLKLRQFTWYLIKLDFILKNPTNSLIEMDYNFIFTEENLITVPPIIQNPQEDIQNSGNHLEIHPPSASVKASKKKRRIEPIHSIILPNDRGIAVMLLREYINKLINSNDEAKSVSNENIKSIFESINKSMMDPEVKFFWERNFSWTLNDI